jgi:hypothetical protein
MELMPLAVRSLGVLLSCVLLAACDGESDSAVDAAAPGSTLGDAGACRIDIDCRQVDPPCLVMGTCPCTWVQALCTAGACEYRTRTTTCD